MPIGLAAVLFAPVQRRVLGLLFGQPQRRFQSAELIRMAGSGTGATYRLMTRLATVGLITTERVGNQKHYQANADSPVFGEQGCRMKPAEDHACAARPLRATPFATLRHTKNRFTKKADNLFVTKPDRSIYSRHDRIIVRNCTDHTGVDEASTPNARRIGHGDVSGAGV